MTADLSGVRWIGGGSGTGKSTVADLLGRRSGLPVVHTDDSIPVHAAARAGEPRVRAFTAASMDERWVARRPEEMLRTFPWFAGDGFDLLLDEVRALPGPRIVEGFRLLPRLVAPLARGLPRAVWLLPTPAVREVALRGRGADRAFWLRTSDPDRAFANLLERDRLFTDRLRAEAQGLGLPVIEVDGTRTAASVAGEVATAITLGT